MQPGRWTRRASRHERVASVAREGPGVRVDAVARQRLEELLAGLRHYQGELADAEREGLEFVAERAREEIRKREGMIRRHCDATGLALPREVTEMST